MCVLCVREGKVGSLQWAQPWGHQANEDLLEPAVGACGFKGENGGLSYPNVNEDLGCFPGKKQVTLAEGLPCTRPCVRT